MRLLVATWLFLASWADVTAQQLFVQRYTTDDYQADDQNWDFAQDKQGVMYVANNDGVLRYTGVKWDLLPIPGQHSAFSMAFDSKDILYVGSYNELGFMAKEKSGEFRYFSLLQYLPDSLKHCKNITQTVIFQDTVLFRGPGHVYIYSGGHFTVISTEGYLLKFRDRPWLRDQTGLHAYNDRGFDPPLAHQELNGLSVRRLKDFTRNTGLLQDEAYNLWIFAPDASPGNKLHRFLPDVEPYFKDAKILNYVRLDDGALVLLSEKGLLLIDNEGKPINFISSAVFAADLTYGRFFLDRNHNLWLMTGNAEIFQIITSSSLSFFDKADGLEGEVLSMGEAGETRYVGTTKGIFWEAKDHAFHPIPNITGEAWNFYSIENRMFAVQEAGIYELKGSQAHKLINQLSPHCLCAIKERPGLLLMGTYNDGMWILAKEPNNTWSKRRVKGFDEEIQFVEEDKEGNFWAGNLSTGVYRLRLTPGMDSVREKMHYDVSKGLPQDINNRMVIWNDGEIFALTSDGIFKYDRDKDRFAPDPAFRKAIPQGWGITTLAATDDGDIYFSGWLATSKAMAAFLHRQPDGSFAFIQSQFRKIAIPMVDRPSEKIQDEEPLLILAPDEIWYGVNEKVIIFDPGRKPFLEDSTVLYMEQLTSGDSVIFRGGQDGPVPVISYGRNRLSFNVFTPYFENPERIEYQYRLKGLENEWSPWTKDHQASYINLHEGDYVFLARAKDIYGRIGKTLQFPIRIRPPWYRTLWAYLCYILAILSGVYGVVRMNTRRMAAINQVLERKVEEKTREIAENTKKLQELNATKDRLFSIISHDLRGPFSSMKAVVDAMKSVTTSEQDVRAFGVALGDHLFVTGQLLNNLLSWSQTQMDGMQPNPQRFALFEVAEESRLLFRVLAEDRSVQLVNQVPVSCQVKADKEITRMVMRNLVNNAVKFTRSGGKVVIGVERRDNLVQVYVKDEGIGISDEGIAKIIHRRPFHKPDANGQMGAGLGLLLCQELLERVKSQLVIESSVGEGSRFSFSITAENQQRTD